MTRRVKISLWIVAVLAGLAGIAARNGLTGTRVDGVERVRTPSVVVPDATICPRGYVPSATAGICDRVLSPP